MRADSFACDGQFENRFSVKLTSNREDTGNLNVLFVQPESTRDAVKEQLMQLNDWELSALDKVCTHSKHDARP